MGGGVQRLRGDEHTDKLEQGPNTFPFPPPPFLRKPLFYLRPLPLGPTSQFNSQQVLLLPAAAQTTFDPPPLLTTLSFTLPPYLRLLPIRVNLPIKSTEVRQVLLLPAAALISECGTGLLSGTSIL